MDAEERRAAARAAGSAATEITRTVEDVSKVARRRVRGMLGPIAALPMDLIDTHSSAVYATVRGTTTVVAEGAGTVIASRTPAGALRTADDPTKAGLVAALSAAFGDRLDPALTTPMSLRRDGAPIAVADLRFDDELYVFVHGLGATELQWSSHYLATVDHALVRYNSGRAVADNGADLDALLRQIVEFHAPSRIVLVAHSMGGLVAHAAIEHGTDSRWLPLLTDLVTLGTPHTGAGLERVSARTLSFGQAFASAEPIIRLGNRRSRGIKDLRFGATRHSDWHGEIDDQHVDMTAPITVPDHVEHHALAGTLGPTITDGMVTIDSARSPRGHATVLSGVGHLALLDSPEITALLNSLGGR